MYESGSVSSGQLFNNPRLDVFSELHCKMLQNGFFNKPFGRSEYPCFGVISDGVSFDFKEWEVLYATFLLF